MTIGMRTYTRVKNIEEKLNKIGFVFGNAEWHRDTDFFSLLANDDKLPVYRKGAEIFRGNLDEMESFLNGVEWARQYDHMLGLKTGQRRERAESRVRKRQLVQTIKESSKKNGQEEEYPL